MVSGPESSRRQMQLFSRRWHEVRAMQERLVSAEPPENPSANLARGLALIALAPRPDIPIPEPSDRDQEAAQVRHIWQRLRARSKR